MQLRIKPRSSLVDDLAQLLLSFPSGSLAHCPLATVASGHSPAHQSPPTREVQQFQGHCLLIEPHVASSTAALRWRCTCPSDVFCSFGACFFH